MRLETKNHYKYCWIWYIVHVLGMIFYTCCCRVNVLSQIRTSRIRRLLPLGRGVYLEITGAEFPSVPTHHRPHQDNTSTEPSGVFLESSANRTIQQIQIQYTVGGTSGTNIGICSVSWTAGIKRYNFSDNEAIHKNNQYSCWSNQYRPRQLLGQLNHPGEPILLSLKPNRVNFSSFVFIADMEWLCT